MYKCPNCGNQVGFTLHNAPDEQYIECDSCGEISPIEEIPSIMEEQKETEGGKWEKKDMHKIAQAFELIAKDIEKLDRDIKGVRQEVKELKSLMLQRKINERRRY